MCQVSIKKSARLQLISHNLCLQHGAINSAMTSYSANGTAVKQINGQDKRFYDIDCASCSPSVCRVQVMFSQARVEGHLSEPGTLKPVWTCWENTWFTKSRTSLGVSRSRVPLEQCLSRQCHITWSSMLSAPSTTRCHRSVHSARTTSSCRQSATRKPLTFVNW